MRALSPTDWSKEMLGFLLAVGLVSAIVFVVFNYRGRYGRSNLGVAPALVVGTIIVAAVLAWQAIS